MRKVYTPPPVSGGRFWPIAGAVGLSFVLFLLLPFTTMISGNRAEKVELTKVGAVDAPPPDNQPPPELAPAEAQPMSIDQLTADVAVGGGGFLAGMLMSTTENPQEAMKEMIFSMEDLDQKPVAIAQIAPLHPRDLLKAKVEGQVVLLFVVDEQGRVEDPRVENSSRPEFEKPALDAVRKWKFKPGTKEGAPVKTYIRQPIRFSIATS